MTTSWTTATPSSSAGSPKRLRRTRPGSRPLGLPPGGVPRHPDARPARSRRPAGSRPTARDYHYTGRVNAALPVPPLLEPFLAWAREAIDGRLNGLLLNWYDGELGHYIGPHHDSIKDMVPGAPIVTISLGEERVFRLTQPETKERRDFPAPDGTVFVMPYDTNLAWKHAVPKSAKRRGRRISVTLRAFDRQGKPWISRT